MNDLDGLHERGRSACTRRAFVAGAAAGVATAMVAGTGGVTLAEDAPAGQAFVVPLNDATRLSIDGPHRFHTIAGRTGFHCQSLKTQAVVTTDLHCRPSGTLSLWFSPLEDLTFAPANQSNTKVAFTFPFVSDTFPPRMIEKASFAIAFSTGYPEVLAKFAAGGVWEKLDHGLAPFVYAEKAVLRQGYWYHLALTWDRPAKRLAIYLNGMMAGHNDRADNFEQAAGQLYVGNPMMLLADLRLEGRALEAADVLAQYRDARPGANELPDGELNRMLAPAFLAPLDLQRDAPWKQAYECSFTHPADLNDWVRQGPGDKDLSGFRMDVTGEGLYLKTPDQVDIETRMYLWSKRRFEGDQWIEFDFRVESPRGLALLVACASGMQREDFIDDHGVPATGSMGTILRDVRCYHWEFVRRVEAMRTDVETQYLAKNPFGLRLHAGCVPRLVEGRWYRLRFIKCGRRLHGSFDGRTVFDVTDEALNNNGPVYNFGRIGMRQMYHTALRYRNLVVYERS